MGKGGKQRPVRESCHFKEVKGKTTYCGNPVFPTGQVLQHCAGCIQGLRVGRDVRGLEGDVLK